MMLIASATGIASAKAEAKVAGTQAEVIVIMIVKIDSDASYAKERKVFRSRGVLF